jgi:CubicO group peptidase (beta-lactamase class C family)
MQHETRSIAAVLIAVCLVACGNDATGPSSYPAADAQNVDGFALSEATNQLSRVEGMRSFLVARNGVLMAEEYFNGTGPGDVHDVRSVTKSVTSALIGIAIEQGFIESVDETLADYLVGPVVDDIDAAKGAIQIRHLLSMTAGFEWHQMGDGPDFSRWVSADDQIQFVLDRPLVNAPGTRFTYSDGVAHLLSVILAEATGMKARDFAQQYLFTPLGIGERTWLERNRGYNSGGVGLRLTPLDMLAFGTLFLNRGVHNDRQVVPTDWVRESRWPHVFTVAERDAVPFSAAYGYLWWTGAGANHPFYFANGYGGQFIVVVPAVQMVVVTSCDWWGVERAAEHWYEILSTVVQTVIPAAR